MTSHPNFLSEIHAEVTPPALRHRTRRWWVIGILVVLVAYLALAAWGAGRVLASALAAKDSLEDAQKAALVLDFDAANQALETTSLELDRASVGLRALAPFRVIPYLGDQVRAVDEMLKASERLIPALSSALTIAEGIVEVVERAEALGSVSVEGELSYVTLPEEVRKDLLTRLHQSLPDLQTIRARLTLAAEDVTRLQELRLVAPIAVAVEPFVRLIPELQKSVDFLIPIAEIVPTFAGLDAPKRYLVLYENNTELRPGGGFVGNFIGTMTVETGAISGIDTEDTYAIDDLVAGLVTTVPPEPLKKFLGVDAWYFRDANWSPDFATSAEQALSLLAQEEDLIGREPSVYNGVIAVTPTLAASLLELVGEVTIDGQTFTPENIADTLAYQVEFGFAEQGLPPSQRKEIVDELSEVVAERLFNLPLSSWVQVSGIALEAIANKQLMLYSTDADVQQALADAGWSGAVSAPEVGADALMVVDANLASLKSDPAVTRTINYRLRQNDDGRLVAQVRVEYDHQGDFDWKTTRYRTYTRVYVPLGSELIRGEGMLMNDKLHNPELLPGVIDVGEELGLTTFGAFIAIEPGESRTLSYSYYLPEDVSRELAAGNYSLRVFKQLGAQNHALTVDVDFGKPLLSATPSEDPSEYGDTQYLLKTYLDQDLEMTIRF